MDRSIREGSPADLTQLVDTLSCAFQHDLALSWILPDPAQRRLRLPKLFDIVVRSDFAAGSVLRSESCEAVSLARNGIASPQRHRLLVPSLCGRASRASRQRLGRRCHPRRRDSRAVAGSAGLSWRRPKNRMWRYTSNSASKWLVRGTSPKEVPISGPCSAKI